ncbi:hypothetical protein [Duganella violaceipulchra]|uniref:Uncharacterized protein n=1 Tax=Duganella violaceipulchra TaxID=2849652 RepID=A0AA41LAL2_9BURK|nr:hypothetical protein [Duganella violaceicalia]MBV6324385.1 hypothetical protein [Duganella violaceicalia]MCP2011987.1 hypothetical protein [Duganella violaceicalia]
MLNLTDKIERFLKQTGALIKDSDGQDVLRGLSYSESSFFIEYEQNEDPSSAERELYLQLRKRHLSARLHAMGLSAPVHFYN